MGVGQLSESDAVDALRLPFYSSSHPTGSPGWRNQFDLGNPEVNGLETTTFTIPETSLRDTFIAESPIESVEVMILESAPPQYQLRVVSGMPSQTMNCSRRL